MDIAANILQKKSKTVSLRELEKLSQTSEYSGFVSEVQGFISSGLLRPMGKETNGKFPPLHSRYRICREEQDDLSVKEEILRLGPEFKPSSYLSALSSYNKHKKLLWGLFDYVHTKNNELALSMSKNERSYAIWGNEKQMDDPVCRSMLRLTGWESRLNYYDTPEPFLDYLCHGANTKSILILENKDIWFSLRKLFMERRTACQLFGQWFDGLLYGEGKKITRQNALEDYSKEGFFEPPSFFYWGDLDYEGVSIFLKLSAFPVLLFVPGYMAMLEYGRSRTLTQCRARQITPPQMDNFMKCFDTSIALEINTILESGQYIPQEICNYPRLKAALDVTL